MNKVIKTMDKFYGISELNEENLNFILRFEKDGMYYLAESDEIPNDKDAYRDSMVYPVYHAAVLLLKYYRSGHSEVYEKMEKALEKSIWMGLGYSEFMSEGNNIGNISELINNGILEVFPEKTSIGKKFRELIDDLRLVSVENARYEEIRNFFKKYDKNIIFTYGTLMKGQRNHNYLRDESYLGDSILKDYGLLELRGFPGAIPSEGKSVYGELYFVNNEEKKSIDHLEGSLYTYKMDFFYSNGKLYYAGYYDYNYPEEANTHDFRIPYGKWDSKKMNKDEYVWYVCYGSNLCYERFMRYINRTTSKKEPLCKETIIINHPLYFDSYTKLWDGAKAFIGLNESGKTYGVKYLISKDQYEEIKCMEGSDYDLEYSFGDDEYGIIQLTFTTSRKYDTHCHPSSEYLMTIRKGLNENYENVEEDYIVNRLLGKDL